MMINIFVPFLKILIFFGFFFFGKRISSSKKLYFTKIEGQKKIKTTGSVNIFNRN